MKKILLIHQYFKLPDEGSGIRSYYLAREMAKMGHDVTVLTTHNQKYGKVRIEGFTVHYFKIPYENQFGFVKRILAFFRFVAVCNRFIIKETKPDLCYVMSTPLTTGYVALYAKSSFQIPYIFEVGDLWPEAPIQLGVIKWPYFKNKLYQLETNIYKQSAHVVALSEDIQTYIQDRMGNQTGVSVITNFSDCDFFQPSALPQSFTHQAPLKIAYTGAISLANHLEYLVDLAKAANAENLPVHIYIMGDGQALKKIQKLSDGLRNLSIQSFGDKNAVRKLLAECHAVYVSYLNVPVLHTGSPNKFFDGLAAGKAIILNTEGWMKKLVETTDCGFSYPPANPSIALQELKQWISRPEHLEEKQRSARKLAETRFDVPVLAQRLNEILSAQRIE